MFPKTIFIALGTLLVATRVSGKSTGRIVGGFPISIKMAPYQVSLQYTEADKSETRHFCGGSILSNRWIATAAHCTLDLKRTDLIVLVGTSYYNREGKKIPVEQIVNHRNYSVRNKDNDIALLKLSENLVFNDLIQPIALPNDNEAIGAGEMCLVSGWGYESKSMLLRKADLRGVEVPVVDHGQCNNNYKGHITQRMICAGFKEGGKDACQGDSGGPLACAVASKMRSGNQTTILTGITSWGRNCAEANYPGVYADVRMLRAWIREQTGL